MNFNLVNYILTKLLECLVLGYTASLQRIIMLLLQLRSGTAKDIPDESQVWKEADSQEKPCGPLCLPKPDDKEG